MAVCLFFAAEKDQQGANAMKRSIRILSVFLCAVLLSALLVPMTALADVRTSDPVIYVRGQGTPLYNIEGEQIYPLEVEDGYIGDAVKDCLPLFMDGVRTGEWDAYCDALYEAVYPIFEEIALDENGEASDGSGIQWTWSRSTLKDTKKNGTYAMRDYMYYYDWRLDPWTIADDLSGYINAVMAVTGAKKVNIIGRCEGACVVQAYMVKYGTSKINNYCLYSQALSGVNTVSGTFSGKIQIDADSVDRYADYYMTTANTVVNDLMQSIIDMVVITNGMNLATSFVNDIYAEVCANILPRLVLATYGTMPGIWAMVDLDDYSDAMTFNFKGREIEYAGLISKITNFHNKVAVPFEADLKKFERNGVDIAVVSKYGFQSIPLFENNEVLSDGASTVENTTLGATTALVNQTLSEDYISARTKAGYAAYISPDKQIDMSTCLFPDKTWIIKNLEHSVFPECAEELISAFFITDGEMDIDTYDVFPQFTVYDAQTKTIEPMTESNSQNSWSEIGIMEKIANFFRSIINMFLRIFNNMLNLDLTN